VSLTPTANLLRVSLSMLENLLLLSTTLAALVGKFTVVDIGGAP
jgi:hypothetical protein